MAKSLDESDVGISCFVSSLPGFRGILKQRYSDFIVNEVDVDGNIVHLTSFDLPLEDTEGEVEDNACSDDKDYTSVIESFRLLCGEVDADALKEFIAKVLSLERDVPPVMLAPDPDKSHRAEVHNFFKKNFKFLVTDTVEESGENSKYIRVRRRSGNGGGPSKRGMKRKDKDDKPFDSRGSKSWPEHLGKFLRFNLYKENKDTQEALGLIGKMLGVNQRSFGFAGTKDKRSVSTQRVTIFKQRAKRLSELNSRMFGIKVGDFCYVNEGLVLGQLTGNHFTITLRGISADSEDIIKEATDSLWRNGFINYYGLQRFGSGSVPTHLVGAALLKGEWKTAASLILDPREGERPIVREAREYYKEHGDVDLTLKKLPRHLVAERSILQCLKKFPGNYLQALKTIPRTLRMMYVHSYQSYLWNHAASMRVQKYGISQVVLGDLVLCKEVLPTVCDSSEHEDDFNDGDNSLLDLSDELPSEENVQFVKAVDSEDLLKGHYTFEDVVLPLPGSRIRYPTNDIANVYHDLAKKDGISLTEGVHGAKEFSISSMKGAYRQVFQRPIDFVWELVDYTNDNLPLAETDLDILEKAANMTQNEVHVDGICSSQIKTSDTENSIGTHLDEDSNENPLSTIETINSSDILSKKQALKMAFTLPTSCYATMAIREILKSSTSSWMSRLCRFLIIKH
ncbi:multisubstrate pseudouridine synthase 7-like isoform X1 [Zingiber officinale]|uniref:multisubstrate pseudouridine synthase 7-like isoform X1 n=1 Tax=Zingiber officinale TaxID=94328 RepID=UPI001C4B68FA|nr:multisubstrate pseudouridine synthase 7-like isoform X1 [Zingiber officinale]